MVASSGVRIDESNGVSNSVSADGVDLDFSGDFFRSGAKRSLRVLNSNFSKSGLTSSSLGPLQSSASI